MSLASISQHFQTSITETTWLTELKCHFYTLWMQEKVCSNDHVCITQMAAIPIDIEKPL